MEAKPTLTLDQPATYRLHLQGHVSADWSDWLTDAAVMFADDQTILTGVLRDQAALFGLLSFVRDLGVPLYSAEFLPKENDVNKNLFETVCKAVALGMGVVVIVLNTLGSLAVDTAVALLGIGLTALAIAGLQK